MSRRPRWLVCLVGAAVATLTASCAGSSGPVAGGSGSPIATSSARPSAAFSFFDDGTMMAAHAALCPSTRTTSDGKSAASRSDADVKSIMREVEQARDLSYADPVQTQAVSASVMAGRIRAISRQETAGDQLARRGRALATMGVLPEDIDLEAVLRSFYAGQVLGFYDPKSDELVYIGDDRLSPLAHYTLAHELTHALDDQRFGLNGMQALAEDCNDEAATALQTLIEGDAVAVSQDVVAQMPLSEQLGLMKAADEVDDIPEGTPPFIVQDALFPYVEGAGYIAALRDRGGNGAIDDAFEDPPTLTEQILHPDASVREPADVQIQDLGAAMGPGWSDLDVMQAGEGFLRNVLQMHGSGDPGRASAGWNGGYLRAWENLHGDRVVALATAWDSPGDAEEFARALADWPGNAGVARGGDRVDVLFASNADTLQRATDVAAAPE